MKPKTIKAVPDPKPRKEVLATHAETLWRVFVEGDPELATSTCGCCGAKRKLRRTIFEESARLDEQDARQLALKGT